MQQFGICRFKHVSNGTRPWKFHVGRCGSYINDSGNVGLDWDAGEEEVALIVVIPYTTKKKESAQDVVRRAFPGL